MKNTSLLVKTPVRWEKHPKCELFGVLQDIVWEPRMQTVAGEGVFLGCFIQDMHFDGAMLHLSLTPPDLLCEKLMDTH